MTEPQVTDYEAEAGAILELVSVVRDCGHDVSDLRLMQVGCGEGYHLGHLNRWFGTVVGTDVDVERLRQARDRLPLMTILAADVRTMFIGTRGLIAPNVSYFDVVLCLSGAVGYMETIEDLQQAVQTMVGHLNPHGILILEPNLDYFTHEQFGEVLLDAGLEVHFNEGGLSPAGRGVYYGVMPWFRKLAP